MKFIETIKNVYKIEELRNRIILTLGLLLVYRFGAQVVLPGIDAARLTEFAGKFDDGGNDWSKKRLSIDPTNFKCLNYITPLQRAENAEDYGLTQNQLEVDRDYYCLDGNRSEGGCSQSSFGAINDFSIQKPVLNSISTSYSQIVSSSVEYMTTETSWDVNILYYFIIKIFKIYSFIIGY